MELYLNQTSPYARVVRICAIEKKLINDVTLKWVDPWTDDGELLKANPNSRIPALVTADGNAIAESLLIALYLDGFDSGHSLAPQHNREEILSLAGLGQGLTDAAFTTVISRKHLGSESDQSVLGERRHRAIVRCLRRLDEAVEREVMGSEINLAQIINAVALSYIAFRLPEIHWQSDFPKLADWYNRISKRESVVATAFVESC